MSEKRLYDMSIFTKAGHVSEEALGLHALSDLPESGVGTVEAHLSRCRHCRLDFKEIRDFISLFRAAVKSSEVH
ncbi:MAG: hypothetical protein HY235_21610 [Acidobacteria bacterium]|nr:hypothetical protein [Acidobacteriota bacterium]